MSRNAIGGAQNFSTVLYIEDQTTQNPDTTITATTEGLALWYRRENGTKVSISNITNLVSANAAHTDGGIIHISDGYYRLDIPDAATATGAAGVLVGGSATGKTIHATYHNIDPPVNVYKWLGTTCKTPNTAGVPKVDMEYVGGTSAELRTQFDANIVKWKGATPSDLVDTDKVAAYIDQKVTVEANEDKTDYLLADSVIDQLLTAIQSIELTIDETALQSVLTQAISELSVRPERVVLGPCLKPLRATLTVTKT